MSTRETQDRRLEDLLKRQLGVLLQPMADPAVTDILINEDGSVWYETAGIGLSCHEGLHFSELVREALIGTAAAMLGIVADRDHPIVEGELALERMRFEGLIPPVVPAPCIALRKPSKIQFHLEHYLRDQIITGKQAEFLRGAIDRRLNLVIGGSTGSGKTTLAGALINETVARSDPNERYVTLEDTFELAITARNIVRLRASESADMTRLLRAAMRLRPDRIIVGEVRGGEALALLKAWNTGHPGGVATVHANSAEAVLQRLGSLVQEAGVPPQPELIADSIDVLAFIEKTPRGVRRLSELLQLENYTADGGFQLRSVGA